MIEGCPRDVIYASENIHRRIFAYGQDQAGSTGPAHKASIVPEDGK